MGKDLREPSEWGESSVIQVNENFDLASTCSCRLPGKRLTRKIMASAGTIVWRELPLQPSP